MKALVTAETNSFADAHVSGITGKRIMKAALLGLSGLFFLAANAQAGDPERGKELSTTCAACHGETGLSEIPANPILAGQYVSYLEHALKAYRSGSRQNAIMAGFATQLSDEDIADLAAYFASQDGPLQTTPIE